jgi:putative SOS response-associated peptidase YedK
MCGRYTLRLSWSDIVRRYGITTQGMPLNLPARYNIAPTQEVPIIRRAADGGRELVLARWGMIPSWSKGPDAKFSMHNARAETITEKPAFRDAFRAQRCLVPADGFYEWEKVGGLKQPWRFTVIDPLAPAGEPVEGPVAFAGLWDSWKGPAGEVISFTIVVTVANALLARIHDRMPVIVDPADWDSWLDSSGPLDAARALLKPFPVERMRAAKVSPRVNNVRNDDPDVLKPPLEQTGFLGF